MANVHPIPIAPTPKPVLMPNKPAQPPTVDVKKTSWSRVWPWLASVIGATGIAALTWVYGAPLVLGPVVTVSSVIRTNLVQTLVASGHVETPFRISVSSRISGVVSLIPVSEGDTVSAGDTLIVLDSSEARATVLQAEGQVAQAEARKRQITELTLPLAEQSLGGAKATLQNAQQIYDRAAKLAKSGVGTRAAREEAERYLTVARTQSGEAELQVLTNRVGGSDYVLAETQLAQAQAGLSAAKIRMGYSEIRAERGGILIARNVEVGNVVQPGLELMQLSPVGDVQIVVQIDEKNLGLVALGQDALASADAYGKQTFAVKVAFINPAVDLQRASVEVKLKVTDPPDYLRQDMTVSVDIRVASRQHALVIEFADVHEPATDEPWVLKIVDGRAQRQAVKVGLISTGKVEILNGLAEGDKVIPATLTTISDGSKVRTAAKNIP